MDDPSGLPYSGIKSSIQKLRKNSLEREGRENNNGCLAVVHKSHYIGMHCTCMETEHAHYYSACVFKD